VFCGCCCGECIVYYLVLVVGDVLVYLVDVVGELVGGEV